ncbi:winged helix-turn-helix transcriptional regulator [Aquipuribacter nitratireducens]|uniref:Winged helix-turn-helix transcriptional regulator n=1 Tax=Aquipuribacter nitratireducens TaxID=650104 RepID=A0ABW0GMC0_9MICO
MTTVRPCSVHDALELLGPRWTFLVLRELMFGTTRFDAVVAATGASRNLVAERLRRLEEAGLVRRDTYQEHPPRHDYRLTDEGRRVAEVLLVLMRVGDERRDDEPPVRWHHGSGGDRHELDVELVCRRCGRPASEGLGDPVGRGAP